MNDGGDETCDVVQVKLISLPLFIKSSWFPRIFAFDTETMGEKKVRKEIIESRNNTRQQFIPKIILRLQCRGGEKEWILIGTSVALLIRNFEFEVRDLRKFGNGFFITFYQSLGKSEFSTIARIFWKTISCFRQFMAESMGFLNIPTS